MWLYIPVTELIWLLLISHPVHEAEFACVVAYWLLTYQDDLLRNGHFN